MLRRLAERAYPGRTMLFVAALIVMGCGDRVTVSGPTATTAGGGSTNRVFGRVIDGLTHQGLAGVRVTLIVQGSLMETTTSADSTPGDRFDDAGYFGFSSVPNGNQTVEVGDSIHSLLSLPVTVNGVTDMGTLALGHQFTLNVTVSAGGLAVPDSVSVIAFGTATTSECSGSLGLNYSRGEVRAMTSGGTGTAELLLDACTAYQIVVPAQVIGGAMYRTAGVAFGGRSNSDTTIGVGLTATQRDDAIGLIATSMSGPAFAFTRSNLSHVGAGNGTALTLTPVNSSLRLASRDPIKLVFNYPVVVPNVFTATYVDDLRNPDSDNNDQIDPGFPQTTVISGLSATLSANGTILTITPPSGGFPLNQAVLIRGTLSAVVNGVTVSSDLSGLIGNQIFVVDPLPSGLTPTLDNYNGTSTGGGAAAPAYLEFPTPVSGNFRVIAVTPANGTRQVINGPATPFPGTSDLVFTDGTTAPGCSICGTGAKVVFRVSTGLSLANGDQLEVAFVATDLLGNSLASSVILTVQ